MSEGDLSSETGEISLDLGLNSKTGEKSPDWGFHSAMVTGAPQIASNQISRLGRKAGVVFFPNGRTTLAGRVGIAVLIRQPLTTDGAAP